MKIGYIVTSMSYLFSPPDIDAYETKKSKGFKTTHFGHGLTMIIHRSNDPAYPAYGPVTIAPQVQKEERIQW
ncbi:MAG: hypothetical protein PVF74_07610, partial [Anaerolineales bacterium]